LTASRENMNAKHGERRANGRFPFVANAEVSETGSHERLSVRVSEISTNGCYLDMLNPLPMGTKVSVKIFKEADSFDASATVVYSHPNLGVGLAFQDVSQDSQLALQKWLARAMGLVDPASGKP
jgi:hypothetical protein